MLRERRLLKMELNRIGNRPIFWLLILIGFVLAVWSLFDLWPGNVTYDYYVFYPRSAFVSWMYFNANSYHIYNLIFPLLAALAYSDAYAEDFNTGLVKSIFTKVEKKKYLQIRYIVNFCVGGFIVVVPIILNFLAEMTAFPLIKNNFYFGMNLVNGDGFFPDIFYAHPFIYIVSITFLLFALGGVMASLGLALSTLIKNRYVILVFPFLVFMTFDTLAVSLNHSKYSLSLMFFWNIKQNWGIPLVLLVGSVGCFIWFFITGDKSETV